jgi:hypothetical protein
MTIKFISYAFIGAFTLSVPAKSCKSAKPQETVIEYYISPRNPKYGWSDNGVFQFELSQRSIKKSLAESSYTTISKPDSLFELYYLKQSTFALTQDSVLTERLSIDSIWVPSRILIIFHADDRTDTVYVDRNYNARMGNLGYKLSPGFKKTLHDIMPLELRENWVYDLRKW